MVPEDSLEATVCSYSLMFLNMKQYLNQFSF